MRYKLLKKTKNYVITLAFIGLISIIFYGFAVGWLGSNGYTFIPPAGKIMESKAKSFSFAAVSDTGSRNKAIRDIIYNIKNSDNKFILYLGDFVYYNNSEEFTFTSKMIDEELGGFGFYAIPGNHDIFGDTSKADYTLYKNTFGYNYYWFSYGDTVFVALDSATSKLDDKQLEWLDETLSKIRPSFKHCIIYTHVPPASFKNEHNRIIEEESNHKFAEIIKDKNIDLILAGHLHYFHQGTYEGIPLVILPSSGQKIRSDIKKFGYVSVDITPESVNVKEHYVDNNFIKSVRSFLDTWIF